MGNNPFQIKVKNEDNQINEITVRGNDKINILKYRIDKIQDKIDYHYIIIYKGDQLLDENKRVSSYNITPSDILTYKSSRKDEFSVFFYDGNTEVEKLVAKEDGIGSAFQLIRKRFIKEERHNKWIGHSIKFFYENVELYAGKTFGDYNIKQSSKIYVEISIQHLDG